MKKNISLEKIRDGPNLTILTTEIEAIEQKLAAILKLLSVYINDQDDFTELSLPESEDRKFECYYCGRIFKGLEFNHHIKYEEGLEW